MKFLLVCISLYTLLILLPSESASLLQSDENELLPLSFLSNEAKALIKQLKIESGTSLYDKIVEVEAFVEDVDVKGWRDFYSC